MPAPREPGLRSPPSVGRASARSREHTRRHHIDAKAVDSSEEWLEIYIPRRSAANGANDVPRKSHRRGRSYDGTAERTRPESRALPPLPSQTTPTHGTSRSVSRRASRDLPPVPGEGVYIDSNTSSDSSYGQHALARSSVRDRRPHEAPPAYETRETLLRSRTTAGPAPTARNIGRPHLSSRAQTDSQVKHLPVLPASGALEKRRRPTQTPKPITLVTPQQPNAAPPQYGNHVFKVPSSPESEETLEGGYGWVAQSTPAFPHRRTDSDSTISSSNSKTSSSKSSGFMKGPLAQKLKNVLNVPVNVHANGEAHRDSRPLASAKPHHGHTPRSASVSSFLHQPPASATQAPNNFRLRETTTKLVNNYNAFRKSIILSSGASSTELQIQAREYQKTMDEYLKQFAVLPDYVRKLPHVQRLNSQLQQAISVLELAVAQADGEQALTYLDGTIVVCKALLKSAHDILLNHKSVLKRSPSLDEDSDVEYEVASPAVANLIEKTDALESPHSLRRMRSSMAAMSPTAGTGPGSPESLQARGHDDSIRRPLVLGEVDAQQHFAQTQNLDAFSDSLNVLKNVALFSKEKRIRHDKPEDTRHVTYGQDGQPIAMSEDAIIRELIREQSKEAMSDSPGDNFVDIIFTNFRFWWTPEKLLNILMARYQTARTQTLRYVISFLLWRWIFFYWVSSDRVLLTPLNRFLGRMLGDRTYDTHQITMILERLGRYRTQGGDAIERPSPDWIVEKMPFRFADVNRDMPLARGLYDKVRLLQFNDHESCEEFARQLTLKESALYLSITPAEVVKCFVQPGMNTHAEMKLRQQREFSTKLKQWATYSVLKEKDPAKRAKTFGFLARVANVCVRLRNFSSAHSIYNGLESVHIDSLPLTKAELSPKGKRLFETVSKFFAENKDICMQVTALPTIPLMGVYAGKLQRLKEVKTSMWTPSKVDDSVNLINVSLFRGATRVVFAMESNQIPYNFKAHLPVQDYLDYLLAPAHTDDGLHRLFREIKQSELEAPNPKTSTFVSRLRSGSLSMGMRPRLDH